MVNRHSLPVLYNALRAVLIGLLIAVLLILIFQHWMHVWIWLPYAIILACPIMMFFMMQSMQRPEPPR